MGWEEGEESGVKVEAYWWWVLREERWYRRDQEEVELVEKRGLKAMEVEGKVDEQHAKYIVEVKGAEIWRWE